MWRGSGTVELFLAKFAGIVELVTKGPIVCAGTGWVNPSDPCEVDTHAHTPCGTVATTSTGLVVPILSPPPPPPVQVTVINGYNHVAQAVANCVPDDDCLYTGVLSATSLSGQITVYMNSTL